MDTPEQKEQWIERIEHLVSLLEGSSIAELELTEAGTEIIIRRQPAMVMVPTSYVSGSQPAISAGGVAPNEKEDAILAPLTGVYFSSPSPTSPPFVSVGDMVQVGQVVALIEAMKVFNEIQAERAGRVSALVATTTEVVQKGDVLIRILAI